MSLSAASCHVKHFQIVNLLNQFAIFVFFSLWYHFELSLSIRNWLDVHSTVSRIRIKMIERRQFCQMSQFIWSLSSWNILGMTICPNRILISNPSIHTWYIGNYMFIVHVYKFRLLNYYFSKKKEDDKHTQNFNWILLALNVACNAKTMDAK